jgi:hypothetical protein
MKNIKLHLIVLGLVIISEFIGVLKFKVGPGAIVLLPMLYAMVIGIFLTPKFLKLANEKDMDDAGSLIGVTLMLLMAKYGANIGPTLPKILAASPALILQEIGNLGPPLLAIPIGVFIGLKREVIGGGHSISREPNVALVGELYGLDSEEGKGVLGVYVVGTVLGAIFIGLFASFLAAFTPIHPYALAMATGVGSASMTTAGVGSLVAMYPNMADMITAFGAASNVFTGLDGVYMSIWIALPMSEWLYKKSYRLKYGEYPPVPAKRGVK